MAVLAAIVADEPLPASSLRASLSQPVDAALGRALSKKSTERFPDCVAFADALAQALDGGPRGIALLETAPVGATPGPPAPASVEVVASAWSARGPWLAGALVALAAAGLVALAWSRSRTEPGSDTRARPTELGPLGPDDVLACPILEVEGSGAEDGWLGAAVASAICDRAVWMLGGRAERTRIPADLLELPTSPDDGAQADVFVTPDARRRSERAATRQATAVVRGTVRRDAGALEAQLEVERAGRRIGRVVARGTVREIAVAVTDAWRASGILAAAAPIDEEVAHWTLVSDASTALALHDLRTSERAMDDTTEPCRVLVERAHEINPWVLASTGCPGLVVPTDRVAVTPAELALAARLSAPIDPAAIDALELARSEESSEMGRGRLATAHALALGSQDPERALEIMLVAAPLRRRDGAELWMNLSFWANRTPLGPTISQAYSEWAPADPDSWATRALVAPAGGRVELLRRAHLVAPRNTSAAADLAFAHLATGSLAGARSVASEIAEGGEDLRFVSEMISIVASSAEGRISAARERASRLIESITHPVTYRRQDYYLVDWVIELTVLTGDTTLADAYLRRVLSDLRAGHESDHTQAHDQWVAMLAAVGSPALAAEVLPLLPSRRPVVLAVRALRAGDRAEAARLFRQVLSVGWSMPWRRATRTCPGSRRCVGSPGAPRHEGRSIVRGEQVR